MQATASKINVAPKSAIEKVSLPVTPNKKPKKEMSCLF